MAQENNKQTRGLLSIFTGNGKGKTTSSLGVLLRAVGHNHKVCMIQFIKGSWKCGEQEAVRHFGDLVELHTMGKGFTWKSENLDEDIELAQKAWIFAQETIQKNQHEIVILDELTYLINYKMVDEDLILETLYNRPEKMHVIITGRGASEKLIQAADLVTEMNEIKHPYKNGIKAQPGFDY